MLKRLLWSGAAALWCLVGSAYANDLTNGVAYWGAINSVDFQRRCELQFVVSAVNVTSEPVTATVNGATAAGNATLHFASQPAGVAVGWTVVDTTNSAAIPAGTQVSTLSATPTISQNAASTGVGATDILVFSPPSHVARLALAGQILARAFNPTQLALWVMQNTTVQAEVVTDANTPAPVGTTVLDSQIAFQVNSIFTGLATSLPTTAQSPI